MSQPQKRGKKSVKGAHADAAPPAASIAAAAASNDASPRDVPSVVSSQPPRPVSSASNQTMQSFDSFSSLQSFGSGGSSSSVDSTDSASGARTSLTPAPVSPAPVNLMARALSNADDATLTAASPVAARTPVAASAAADGSASVTPKSIAVVATPVQQAPRVAKLASPQPQPQPLAGSEPGVASTAGVVAELESSAVKLTDALESAATRDDAEAHLAFAGALLVKLLRFVMLCSLALAAGIVSGVQAVAEWVSVAALVVLQAPAADAPVAVESPSLSGAYVAYAFLALRISLAGWVRAAAAAFAAWTSSLLVRFRSAVGGVHTHVLRVVVERYRM